MQMIAIIVLTINLGVRLTVTYQGFDLGTGLTLLALVALSFSYAIDPPHPKPRGKK